MLTKVVVSIFKQFVSFLSEALEFERTFYKNLRICNLMFGALSLRPYLMSSNKSSTVIEFSILRRVYWASSTIIILVSFSFTTTKDWKDLHGCAKFLRKPLQRFLTILNPHCSKFILFSVISLFTRVMNWEHYLGTRLLKFVFLMNSSKTAFFSFHFSISRVLSTHRLS